MEKNNKHKNATVSKAIAELLRLDFTVVLTSVAPQLVTYWGLVPIPAYITSKKEQTNMLSKFIIKLRAILWFTDFRIM